MICFSSVVNSLYNVKYIKLYIGLCKYQRTKAFATSSTSIGLQSDPSAFSRKNSIAFLRSFCSISGSLFLDFSVSKQHKSLLNLSKRNGFYVLTILIKIKVLGFCTFSIIRNPNSIKIDEPMYSLIKTYSRNKLNSINMKEKQYTPK